MRLGQWYNWLLTVSWIPRIGAEFAGYRLDALLGHGGMSIVYRAEHIALERKVALKLLSPQLSEDESFRERFMRESRLAASLDHPNIIPLYEAAEADDVFYIAMRYVDGADLRKLLQQGPLDSRRLVPIIDQTANALTAAHVRGLVHRDVKPANILIDPGAGRDETDHVYLSDFGVAKQTAAPGLTSSGTFVGTVDYASPEQIEGKPLDGRADVYSLGCVVYECLTGTSAFEKDSEVALMYAHLLEPPPVVTEKRSDLPAEIDDVIATAMAKAKEDRYETPKALAAALSRALGAAPAGQASAAPATLLAPAVAATPAADEAIAAEAVAPPSEQPPAQPPVAAASAAEPSAGGPRSRRPVVLLAALLAGIVAIVGGVALAVSLTGDDDGNGGQAVETTGTDTAAPDSASSLVNVVVPTEIASSCATRNVPEPGAIETDICTSSVDAPTSRPDEFELSFFRNAQELQSAYVKAQAGLKPANCGDTPGEQVWIHTSTGKTGGRRSCWIDTENRFVVAWTHEKLGSDDHVDTLGVAREPGRAPTTFASWWNSVNDFLGKCRQQIAEHTCIATIKALTGSP
jgi:serine/threonine-protein kinase